MYHSSFANLIAENESNNKKIANYLEENSVSPEEFFDAAIDQSNAITAKLTEEKRSDIAKKLVSYTFDLFIELLKSDFSNNKNTLTFGNIGHEVEKNSKYPFCATYLEYGTQIETITNYARENKGMEGIPRTKFTRAAIQGEIG